MTTTHRTITVPSESVETYRAMAATWPGGVGMFTTPLYTGSEISHYISSGKIETDAAAAIDDVPAFAAHAGIPVEQAQELRDGMDVSTQRWQDHCARIGVTLEASE